MSRECELTGTKPQVGHKVSHSNIKTKRRWLPNLVNVTLRSDLIGQDFRMRITAATLRTVDKNGGLDAFLLKSRELNLTDSAVKLRRELVKRQAEAAATTAA
jgi:large subunit ribosomal protein L28